ncbi:GNAT family N-acetyltransferase [Streptomyces sp. NPDC101191]|uniref:GNAT family N-acetyltransferase n=1 Tax=Streptomyces sp. NPDC101191 TaxID=3366126 RepID=UPI0037F7C761
MRSARRLDAAAGALRKVTACAFDGLRIPRLRLFVEPWNTAYCRTAEGAGHVREGLLRGWRLVGEECCDMFVYARLGGGPADWRRVVQPPRPPRPPCRPAAGGYAPRRA